MVLVFRRVVDLEEEVESLSFVLGHVDIVLPVVDKKWVDNIRYRLFLFFFCCEIISEMGWEIADFLLGHSLFVHLLLFSQLVVMVPVDVIVPVGILDHLLAYFFFEVGFDGQGPWVNVSTALEEQSKSLVPTRSEPAMLVLLPWVNLEVPVNSRE